MGKCNDKQHLSLTFSRISSSLYSLVSKILRVVSEKSTPVKGSIFSRVASLQPISLLKKKLLHEYFSRILNKSANYLYWRTTLVDCFSIKSTKKLSC